MHRIFGEKKEVPYLERQGAYLIPFKEIYIGVVKTKKGYFLLGGGREKGEDDRECIARECMEEAGFHVLISTKICSAETYYKAPEIGYFHPVQVYYMGELLEKVQEPTEEDHQFVWMKFEDLRGKMYLEMQNWAVEQAWERWGQGEEKKGEERWREKNANKF